jgi:hypothetical protein
MTTPATPERICNVLRERGIPAATVQQYRSLLLRVDEELKLTVSRHLAKVASAVDDSQSIKWWRNRSDGSSTPWCSSPRSAA